MQVGAGVAQFGHQADVALHDGDSASAGMPRRPSLKAMTPAFMLPVHPAPWVIRVSSACWITLNPTRAAAARVHA